MYFTEERIRRILDELQSYIYPDSIPIEKYKMKKGNFTGDEKPDLDTGDWADFYPSDRWGGKEEEDRHYWFRTEITIPQQFDGRMVIYHVKTAEAGRWDLANPQLLAYVNGNPTQGMDVRHQEIVLCEKAKAGEIFQIALHSYCGIKGGLVELKSSITGIDRNVETLYYDLKVPLEVSGLLDKDDKRKNDILSFLTTAVNRIDLRKPFSENFHQTIQNACDYLHSEFYEEYCGGAEVTTLCVGHTHIDVAWLWTLAQTREKVARSFATVLNLMKEYPEYIFMSSQPQLYQFLKEDHPALYAQVRQRVAEGRWEPEGAMWVEADCNLPSGESLVRQIMFGTRFFEREFGVKNEILWLPDVFGYNAALPQILKKSGIKYFISSKLGWNDTNGLPYDSFIWRGLDGTEILTHFITAQSPTFMPTPFAVSYNGRIDAPHVISCWKKYQQKDLHNEVFMAFGYGDGGGGPTKAMLESARRFEKGIPGSPKVKIGKAIDFFHRLEEAVADNPKLPRWVGELYLEATRGTYTSMARNKKYNRKSEFLYQDVELLSIMADKAAGSNQYPQEQLNRGWQTILLNQFHDIIPGTSIKQVYEDSERQYLQVLGEGKEMLRKALDKISGNIALNSMSLIVFNQLSHDRSDLVFFDLPEGDEHIEVIDNGQSVLLQISCRQAAFYAKDIPAKGYKAFEIRKVEEVPAFSEPGELRVSPEILENRFFKIQLDADANIISLYDKINQREVLQAGQRANVLQAFEDKPPEYDAWEISIFYEEKMWEVNDVLSMEVIEAGPLRAALRVKKKFVDSEIIQDMVIYRDIPRIDFVNRIDWKEKQVLLKTAFPVDVHANKATYEIQYGNLERPTHKNTSWDVARFEVCGHKWADLSEEGYGVSLLNDCKYGHDIHDSVMRLTLIKSAIDPNEDADREVHEFTYSLYPHEGGWRTGKTVDMAYSLNCPMYTRLQGAHDGALPATFSLVKVYQENVLVEVVKKAEDSDDIIVRLYECHGRRDQVRLDFFKELTRVWECDLMENNTEEIEVQGNGFAFQIKPYEIKTFKLT